MQNIMVRTVFYTKKNNDIMYKILQSKTFRIHPRKNFKFINTQSNPFRIHPRKNFKFIKNHPNQFKNRLTSRKDSQFMSNTLKNLIEIQCLMSEMQTFMFQFKLIDSNSNKLYNYEMKQKLSKIINLINCCEETNISTILLNPMYRIYNLFSIFDEKFKVLFINLLHLYEKIEKSKSFVQKTLFVFINIWQQYIFSRLINKSLCSTTDLEFLKEKLLNFSNNLQ